nr:YtxH domain-containing protein [Streptomonospora sp. PA3]
MKRHKGGFETEAALARLQQLTREQSERFGPYADQARQLAAERLYQARGWTAPRLETAAHRVEDTVAPRVADLLNTAATRVEPPKPKRGMRLGRRGRRGVPRSLVFAGAAVAGAAALYGVVRLRQAAQDARWQENLDQARDQVRETRDQLAAKARNAKEKVTGTGAELKGDAKEAKDTASSGAKQAASDLNGRVTQ